MVKSRVIASNEIPPRLRHSHSQFQNRLPHPNPASTHPEARHSCHAGECTANEPPLRVLHSHFMPDHPNRPSRSTHRPGNSNLRNHDWQRPIDRCHHHFPPLISKVESLVFRIDTDSHEKYHFNFLLHHNCIHGICFIQLQQEEQI
jgi:hypothetical protein